MLLLLLVVALAVAERVVFPEPLRSFPSISSDGSLLYLQRDAYCIVRANAIKCRKADCELIDSAASDDAFAIMARTNEYIIVLNGVQSIPIGERRPSKWLFDKTLGVALQFGTEITLLDTRGVKRWTLGECKYLLATNPGFVAIQDRGGSVLVISSAGRTVAAYAVEDKRLLSGQFVWPDKPDMALIFPTSIETDGQSMARTANTQVFVRDGQLYQVAVNDSQVTCNAASFAFSNANYVQLIAKHSLWVARFHGLHAIESVDWQTFALPQ